ncbi:beta-ketoacyl-[acyl-carrier-protein] synthase family protein [Psychroflexus sp. ALD_RP9]|uniref:beta-ketoacyl-[acyl-carrier-protein] synthase family protein n=1 Tax=Psychroflexus sp. ALD_RP9 TaxID=2777186 RepID=UPI001A8C4C38|nr:beta-ketoacyl-[acyl-carrier-protein] synthase family protein [Psychroflexus sp. ALD_RP9]QSS97006.1 beta-ketoacyl-[acyl-carrier-protein] synthase family protein [Psychroflexus sp. ALD_RP9]
MNNRVVITGLGVVAPNAIGKKSFLQALKNQINGITFHQDLANKSFSCQVAGTPQVNSNLLNHYFTALEQKGLLASGLIYGGIAGQEAWLDAGLEINKSTDYDTGVIFGTGILGVEKLKEAFNQIENQKVRRLGSTSVLQTMASGVSAFLGGKLGCGNWVTSNSSACTTGTEAFLMGYEHLKLNKAKRMLVGSSSDSGALVWGGFEALRILPYQFNQHPEEASRPMSKNAQGFVPSSGAGALVLETLDSALERQAPIYAEVCGGAINSGGQRQGGSMTAPNSEAVQKCILQSLSNAKVNAAEIDTINGHLTGTAMDAVEINNWHSALNLNDEKFPLINSLKSHIGHALAAAGSLELVASVLQVKHQFVFGNRNLQPIHPDILNQISKKSIPNQSQSTSIKYLIKASFGFGDVNACTVLKQFKNE